MLIVLLIPKQHMHKKENMPFLVIPSVISFTVTPNPREISGDKQSTTTHTQNQLRMINERLKDKTKTVKKD